MVDGCTLGLHTFGFKRRGRWELRTGVTPEVVCERVRLSCCQNEKDRDDLGESHRFTVSNDPTVHETSFNLDPRPQG